MAQFRMLGSSVGVAITSSVLNNYLKHHLASFLDPDQITKLLQTSQTIKSYTPAVQEQIRHVFVHGYNIQFRILVGVAAVNLMSCAMMWRRKNITI